MGQDPAFAVRRQTVGQEGFELGTARADTHIGSSLSRRSISSRSICCTLLLALKTVPTCMRSTGGRLGPGVALQRRQAKGLPGVRLDPLPDARLGHLEPLQIEGFLQSGGQVIVRLDRLEHGVHLWSALAAAARRLLSR